MSIFSYQARNQENELQIGTVEARDKDAAINILQQHHLIITQLEEKAAQPILYRELILFTGISDKEIVVFSRQLATLLEVQVPLVESLRALGNQVQNPRFKGIIFGISADIEGGLSFSKALDRYPKTFSHFYRALVRSSEVAGKLQEAVMYLADHLEREYTIRSKVRGALIYPAFVFTGIIVVSVLMFTIVIPQLISILEESAASLPLTTRIIIGVSKFLQTTLWFLTAGIGALSVLLWRYAKTEEGRIVADGLRLKLPIFGTLFKNLYTSRFAENLGALLTGGISIAVALRISGDVIGNRIYEKIIRETEEAVKRGDTISSVLKMHAEFSPLVVQMIETGETTGKLDMILKNLARFYEREVTIMVDNFVTLIEPILIVVMGVAVGILVLAILQPIYSMVQVF